MAAQFAAADRRTRDGRLDAEEFAAYYRKVGQWAVADTMGGLMQGILLSVLHGDSARLGEAA